MSIREDIAAILRDCANYHRDHGECYPDQAPCPAPALDRGARTLLWTEAGRYGPERERDINRLEEALESCREELSSMETQLRYQMERNERSRQIIAAYGDLADSMSAIRAKAPR